MSRNVVTSRKVTRWYYGGKGYNSQLVAYMQPARRYVHNLQWEAYWRDTAHTRHKFAAWKAAHGVPDCREHAKQWFAARYPLREGCKCHDCSFRRSYGIPSIGHCWLAKMADYRQIAREIIAGDRNMDGSRRLALPWKSTVPELVEA